MALRAKLLRSYYAYPYRYREPCAFNSPTANCEYYPLRVFRVVDDSWCERQEWMEQPDARRESCVLLKHTGLYLSERATNHPPSPYPSRNTSVQRSGASVSSSISRFSILLCPATVPYAALSDQCHLLHIRELTLFPRHLSIAGESSHREYPSLASRQFLTHAWSSRRSH